VKDRNHIFQIMSGILFTDMHEEVNTLEEVISRPTDVIIRPRVTAEEAVAFLERHYGRKTVKIREVPSYDDRNFHVQLEPYKMCNGATLADEAVEMRQEFLLKFSNSVDSSNPSVLALQNEMLLFLHTEGMPVQRPLLSKDGNYVEVEELETPIDKTGRTINRKHAFRLLSWLPGEVLSGMPLTLPFYEEIGDVVGKLANLLQKFPRHQSKVPSNPSLWNLKQVPRLREFIPHVHGADRRQLLNTIVDTFEEKVLSKEDQLSKGWIHGDLNDLNLLVTCANPEAESKEWHLSGILDWQDLSYSYLIYDLGILIMYLMIATDLPEPSSDKIFPLIGHYTLRGYLKEGAGLLKKEELDLLPLIVATRFAQSLCIGEYTARVLEPGNEYVLRTAKYGWSHLVYTWNNLDKLYELWLNNDNDHVISSNE
jgi:hydroxylysine kinase